MSEQINVFLECEFCYEVKSDVELVTNPYNDCHIIALCEQCLEFAHDNAREAPIYD